MLCVTQRKRQKIGMIHTTALQFGLEGLTGTKFCITIYL
jgi:hypothetical protein